MPVNDVICIPPKDPDWRRSERKKAASALGLSDVAWWSTDYHDENGIRFVAAGNGARSPVMTKSGGVIEATSGAAPSGQVVYKLGDGATFDNPGGLGNPSTSSWYLYARGALTTAPDANGRVNACGFYDTNGVVGVGFLGAYSTTKWCGRWNGNNGQVLSTVSIDTNAHDFRMWHKASSGLVYIQVDTESPIPTADTLIGATLVSTWFVELFGGAVNQKFHFDRGFFAAQKMT